MDSISSCRSSAACALYPIGFIGCSARHPRFIPALIPAFSVAGEAGATCWVGTSSARWGRIGVVRLMACANANRSALRRSDGSQTWLALSLLHDTARAYCSAIRTQSTRTRRCLPRGATLPIAAPSCPNSQGRTTRQCVRHGPQDASVGAPGGRTSVQHRARCSRAFEMRRVPGLLGSGR